MPARPIDHRQIAEVEQGGIPDKMPRAEQKKLTFLAVFSESAYKGELN